MSERAAHYIGFRDDRYLNALRVWGGPRFIHCGFDLRALRDIGPDDVVIFADGPAEQLPRRKSFDDLREDAACT